MKLLENTVSELSKVLIYLIVLSVGLTMGYIYVVDMLKVRYRDGISDIINGNVDGVLRGLDNKTRKMVILLSKVLPLEKMLENYKTPNSYVEERNRNLGNIMKICLVVLCILTLMVAFLCRKEMVSINEVLIQVCLVYGVVGLVMYSYLKQDLLDWSKIIMDENIAKMIVQFKDGARSN